MLLLFIISKTIKIFRGLVSIYESYQWKSQVGCKEKKRKNALKHFKGPKINFFFVVGWGYLCIDLPFAQQTNFSLCS